MEAPAQGPSVDAKMTSATGGRQDKESDYTETYSHNSQCPATNEMSWNAESGRGVCGQLL